MSEDRLFEKRTYNADSIKVLEPVECIRKRPGMYVGDVHDGSGLLHMVWELVGNSLDQHLARRTNRLRIDASDDGWITVEDDGPGIPVDIVPGRGLSALEVICTELHRGPTWDGHVPHVHLGRELRGVGIVAVCALSSRFEVESRRRGKLWRCIFENGRVTVPLACHGAAAKPGTRIRFRPDPSVFPAPFVDRVALEKRLRELAWMYPHFAIEWQGGRLPWRGGLAGWVRELIGCGSDDAVDYEYSRVADDSSLDIALHWTDRPTSLVRGFVNGMEATRGGTHVTGMWRGLVELAHRFGSDAAPGVVREILEPGLVAVVHVGLLAPQFASPDRSKLVAPIAATVVARAIRESVPLAMGVPRSTAESDEPLRVTGIDVGIARVIRKRLGLVG